VTITRLSDGHVSKLRKPDYLFSSDMSSGEPRSKFKYSRVTYQPTVLSITVAHVFSNTVVNGVMYYCNVSAVSVNGFKQIPKVAHGMVISKAVQCASQHDSLG